MTTPLPVEPTEPQPKPVEPQTPASLIQPSVPAEPVVEEPFDKDRAMATIKAQRKEETRLKAELKDYERLKAEEQKRQDEQLSETER